MGWQQSKIKSAQHAVAMVLDENVCLQILMIKQELQMYAIGPFDAKTCQHAHTVLTLFNQ